MAVPKLSDVGRRPRAAPFSGWRATRWYSGGEVGRLLGQGQGCGAGAPARRAVLAGAIVATVAALSVGLAAAAPGNLTFAGCIGNLAGCTATSPAGALDDAQDVTLSPDGKQLYAAGVNGVSHFTIDAGGNLTFAGCIGNLAGCTATSPAGALNGAQDVTVSPDGKQLYAAASSDTVSHFTIDAGGNLTFAGCIGNLAGCTATSPAGALNGASGSRGEPGRQAALRSRLHATRSATSRSTPAATSPSPAASGSWRAARRRTRPGRSTAPPESR